MGSRKTAGWNHEEDKRLGDTRLQYFIFFLIGSERRSDCPGWTGRAGCSRDCPGWMTGRETVTPGTAGSETRTTPPPPPPPRTIDPADKAEENRDWLSLSRSFFLKIHKFSLGIACSTSSVGVTCVGARIVVSNLRSIYNVHFCRNKHI